MNSRRPVSVVDSTPSVTLYSLALVLFFYRCLDLIVYIVPFIIVLYLSIQLLSCQSVLINLLTYLLSRLHKPRLSAGRSIRRD